MHFHNMTRVIQIQLRVEERLIIRSWFVVLLICDENKSSINLTYAQNQRRRWSQSKEGNNKFQVFQGFR